MAVAAGASWPPLHHHSQLQRFIFVSQFPQTTTRRKMTRKFPMNCGKKPVGSSSMRTSMKRVWFVNNWTVSMNSFRCVCVACGYGRQILDKRKSFLFSQMSVQRIVEDSPAIELQAEAQHTTGEIETPVNSEILLSIHSAPHFVN